MGLVTVDLDSTLCDTRHRHHLINREGPTDWVAYSLACPDDALIEPVARLVRALARVHTVVIVSGRDAAARRPTLDWLRRNGIPFSDVYLDDHTLTDGQDHGAYKARAVNQAHLDHGGEHIVHIDDWPPVSAALAALGYETLIVTPPRVVEDFDPDGHGHLTFV